MFGTPAGYPFAPVAKRSWVHVPAHEFADFVFLEAKLELDGFEGCTVFPGHFDETVQVFGIEFGFHTGNNRRKWNWFEMDTRFTPKTQKDDAKVGT